MLKGEIIELHSDVPKSLVHRLPRRFLGDILFSVATDKIEKYYDLSESWGGVQVTLVAVRVLMSLMTPGALGPRMLLVILEKWTR